jgi:hypothetical protein
MKFYRQPLSPRIKYCFEHWDNGVPWEHTGAYEVYAAQTGANIDKVVTRYKKLDRIFETVRSEKRLRSREELNPKNFRETGGVRINIGPSGELIFIDGGHHRLAMALILELPVIPAQVGCISRDSLREFRKLRINTHT